MRANKPDFLAECASAAIRMGISYGQYMARRYDMGLVKNPHTEPEPEPDAVCKCCGKPFLRTAQNRVYCSAECKYEGDLKMKRKKYQEVEMMNSDVMFSSRTEEIGCKYKEILELYDFCLKMEIDAKLEQLFDGFKLCFPNGGDFVQHYASYGGENGYVEPAIGCNKDFTAVEVSMGKLLVRQNKDRLNREVRRSE